MCHFLVPARQPEMMHKKLHAPVFAHFRGAVLMHEVFYRKEISMTDMTKAKVYAASLGSVFSEGVCSSLSAPGLSGFDSSEYVIFAVTNSFAFRFGTHRAASAAGKVDS